MDASPRTPPAADSAVEGLPGFIHRYAEVNDTRIHYVIGGEGPAIVLLHGFPYSWAVWRDVMPLLAQAGYILLAPDLHGMGHSAPAGNDSFAKTNVAQDVRGIVQDLGFGPVNLVGMDIGTMVAYAYASRHPGEVRRLVLSESLTPGFGLEELMNPATGGFWHYSPLIKDSRANRAAFKGKLPTPVLVLNGANGIPQASLPDGVREAAEHVTADIVPDAAHTCAHDNPQGTTSILLRFWEYPASIHRSSRWPSDHRPPRQYARNAPA